MPDFFLPTKKAREVLPDTVPRADAIFNIGRASMLVASLMKGSAYFLRRSFDDALHQPYRAQLIPGMYDVFRAARAAGALGTVLSGAGPCLISFVEERDEREEAVGEAMREAFEKHDVKAEIKHLGLEHDGAHMGAQYFKADSALKLGHLDLQLYLERFAPELHVLTRRSAR